MSALRVEDLNVHYGTIHAVQGVSFSVGEREIVSIVGSNGAGKSTIMWTLAGVVERSGGYVEIFGERLPRKPHEVVARGLALVPERRRLFTPLSVEENLVMGAYRRKKGKDLQDDMERCFQLFPILKQRLRQRAGTLSGGEQQMLAISRALISEPKLLLVDEVSMGLMPVLVDKVFEVLGMLNREHGLTILLVEQNALASLGISSRSYVLETGKIVLEGVSGDLLKDPKVQEAYLGL